MLRQASTHTSLNHGQLERDVSDADHGRLMMRHRIARRLAGERGFTLIELLVVVILVGILASIALAVFLNQQDKGRDSGAKSDVNNLARLVQACNAGRDVDDFRSCDTEADLEATIPIDPAAPTAVSGDCGDGDPGAVLQARARVAMAGKECFVVVGMSKSGNKFWFVKHDDGDVVRDCTTHGVNGCPPDGDWAG
jgi:prepilin-type N-terminal cleavage/methylation domain-containing protein